MTTKQKAVLQGILSLSLEDRREVINEVIKYDSKSHIEKGIITESLNKETRMILGPTSSASCPCCGR